jgi:hypothetical protein
MKKIITSIEVEVRMLKMPSNEDRASELQAGPTIEPEVKSSRCCGGP